MKKVGSKQWQHHELTLAHLATIIRAYRGKEDSMRTNWALPMAAVALLMFAGGQTVSGQDK